MVKKIIEIKYEEGEGLDKEEYIGEVVIKRLSFSEKNSLEEESTDIKIMGGQPIVKLSTAKMKEVGLLKSIVSSDLKKTTYYEDKVTKDHKPTTNAYPLDITNIRNMPVELGNLLFDEFTAINTVEDKKKEK